ncbi:unnamed protein product [Hermetia illucens]|uniref:DUF4789 domain-containing protein n=2 Tax=Hermetia illucens TaxID=343691 RepID=A0A7R8UGU3_HERIL|nr:uncharacterized protein LOC119650419 isoform X3 [Hermetia illucens]CAD7080307.1 unnamed protein product [Hermetia illucens]
MRLNRYCVMQKDLAICRIGTCFSLRAMIIVVIQSSALIYFGSDGAIVPPPWSNIDKNPCAALPGGWQMLYWAPLKKCFKIFQVGYPCPDTMELSPPSNNNHTAECRCPPGTAQSVLNDECHTLFTKGPCSDGEYFSPVTDVRTLSTWKTGGAQKLGKCKLGRNCPNGSVFWPPDDKCYALYTRGPCPKGKLLTVGAGQIGECKCENRGALAAYFYNEEDSCYEHFTKGPCQKFGELFLPSRKCGCHPKLPHYYEKTNQCFEIGTPGPCSKGHIFTVSENTDDQNPHASCVCKTGYIPWSDGSCYRLYTRGPCAEGQFLINSTTCTPNICGKGRLYFPEQNTCYKIGSQGPCSLYEVVVFDFTSRPSVDGISYNGVCGCTALIKGLEQTCTSTQEEEKSDSCDSTPGMININGICYKLYTQGPCGSGQWLEPVKQLSSEELTSSNKVQCKCRPGYTTSETKSGTLRCFAPTVGLARWILQLIGYEEAT